MFFSRNTRLREFSFRQFIGTGLGVLAEAVQNRVGIKVLPQGDTSALGKGSHAALDVRVAVLVVSVGHRREIYEN